MEHCALGHACFAGYSLLLKTMSIVELWVSFCSLVVLRFCLCDMEVGMVFQ